MSVAVIPMAAELGWSASDRGLVRKLVSLAHACSGGSLQSGPHMAMHLFPRTCMRACMQWRQVAVRPQYWACMRQVSSAFFWGYSATQIPAGWVSTRWGTSF